MNKIEIKVIDGPNNAGKNMAFLARLTQRGHSINTMDDLQELYDKPYSKELIGSIAALPHGTIKRFSPITIAVVGASRRFLAQIRTHQVGLTYVSASLQYSDYSDKGQFVVPYSLLEADNEMLNSGQPYVFLPSEYYLRACNESMEAYKQIADLTDNDTAGYAAPQGLRNILVIQGNFQSWSYLIRTRACNRNTEETQYVTLRIWEELLKTEYGEEIFGDIGPDCITGSCQEGRMTCRHSLAELQSAAHILGISVPRYIIDSKWPLLKEV